MTIEHPHLDGFLCRLEHALLLLRHVSDTADIGTLLVGGAGAVRADRNVVLLHGDSNKRVNTKESYVKCRKDSSVSTTCILMHAELEKVIKRHYACVRARELVKSIRGVRSMSKCIKAFNRVIFRCYAWMTVGREDPCKDIV